MRTFENLAGGNTSNNSGIDYMIGECHKQSEECGVFIG